MHHILYRITRLDGEFYIGRHSTTNLNDGYFGSGLIIRRSVEKHGKDQHTFEVLETHPDYETLCAREREIINEEMLKNPLCMNLKLGGDGGWNEVNACKEHQSNAGKKGGAVGGKIGGKIGGKLTAAKNIANYNATITPEEMAIRQRKVAATKNAMGTSNKGRVYINNGSEQKMVQKEVLETYLNQGFKIGRIGKPRAPYKKSLPK